jgi:hypothetical protein
MGSMSNVSSAVSAASTVESYTKLDSISLNTSATPTTGTGVAPASYPCTAMMVRAQGVPIEYQLNGAGSYYRIRAFERKLIRGITNASQVSFRRTDYATATPTSQVTNVVCELGTVNVPITVSHYTLTSGNNAGYAPFNSIPTAAVEMTNTGPKELFYKINAFSQFRASITDTTMTVTQLLTGSVRAGQTLSNGVSNNTKVVNQLSGTPGGLGTYTVDISQTVAANTYLQGDGKSAAPILMKRNESVMLTVDNVNQVSITSFDSQGGAYLHAELFSAVPQLPRREFDMAIQLSPEAWTFHSDVSNGGEFIASRPASFAPMQRFNRSGKTLSIFNLAANVISTGGVLADAGLAGEETNTVYSTSAARVTFATAASSNITSLVNTFTPIDSTDCDIHFVIKSLVGANSGLSIDLFSEGDPSAPGANYHTYNFSTSGYSRANGSGSRSFSAKQCSAVGTGANMKALTFGRFRVGGSTGGVVQPEMIKVVKNAESFASFLISTDDGIVTSLTNGLALTAPFNVPVMLFPSTVAGSFGYGALLIDGFRNLQDNHGWQVCLQDFRQETGVDMTNMEYLGSQLKAIDYLTACGFDSEGLRDGSDAGGGAYTRSNTNYKVASRILTSFRTFKNGNGNLGTLFTGEINGTTLNVTAVTSNATVLSVGMIVVDGSNGVDDATVITALGTGTGGVGTYTVNTSQTVSSRLMAADKNSPY